MKRGWAMSKISLKYFSAKELTHTSTGLPNKPDSDKVLQNLQQLGEAILDPAREALGLPIRVNSGYRSIAVNQAIGGARLSQHLRGEAADITSEDNERLLQILRGMVYDQLIRYLDKSGRIRWIHVSYRNGANRRQYMTKHV